MRDGHCKHGVYVGGCGVDWMCFHCEMGYTDEEYRDEMRAISRSYWEQDANCRYIRTVGQMARSFPMESIMSMLSGEAFRAEDLSDEELESEFNTIAFKGKTDAGRGRHFTMTISDDGSLYGIHQQVFGENPELVSATITDAPHWGSTMNGRTFTKGDY